MNDSRSPWTSSRGPVNVLPNLDMAAMNAVVTQMKTIFGRAGAEISHSFPMKSIKEAEDAMIASANRAANAEIRAAKLAGDARVVEAKRGAGLQAWKGLVYRRRVRGTRI